MLPCTASVISLGADGSEQVVEELLDRSADEACRESAPWAHNLCWCLAYGWYFVCIFLSCVFSLFFWSPDFVYFYFVDF